MTFAGHVILMLLMLCGIGSLSAQDLSRFSVTDFSIDPFDLSAKDKQYEKYDGNGERYAIIKVTSSDPDDQLRDYNFNFGNLNHIVEERDGVLWVYVQRNAKLVTITRNGYRPINRFDLHTTIESGRNYVLSLSPEEKRVYTQMVQFKIHPADANAVVMVKREQADSQEELFGNTDETGSVARNLEYGTYTYKVLSGNYHMAQGRFTLNDRLETLAEDIDLRPNFSTITFTVDADADIYVNGEKKGTRHWAGPLRAGRYQVECRQANHKPTTQYVEVAENDNQTIALKAPEPIIGTAAITSTPMGAEIIIDGESYGKTPRNLDLLTGEHTIEVAKTGYKPEKLQFNVEEGSTENVNITLARITTVVIDSDPAGAQIYIDGAFIGNTPYSYDGEPGNHKVKITNANCLPVEEVVYLGKSEELMFRLQKQYIRSTACYVDAGIGIGSEMNVSVGLGAYISNFNLEVSYSYGLQKSPSIYWNYTGEDRDTAPDECRYSPSLILGAKAGYGIPAGPRFELTPQLGYRFTKLSESGDASHISGAYCSAFTIGARAYCALSSRLGISLTPEYAIGVSKSDGFKQLSDLTSKIKNMGEGFNARLALVLTF